MLLEFVSYLSRKGFVCLLFGLLVLIRRVYLSKLLRV